MKTVEDKANLTEGSVKIKKWVGKQKDNIYSSKEIEEID